MLGRLAHPARLVAALLVGLLSIGLVPTGALAAGETLTVTPNSGPGGTATVTLGGAGWPTGRDNTVGEGIEISFDGAVVVRCGTVNKPTGTLESCTPTPFAIPNVEPGVYNFTAVDPLDPAKTASAPFTVAPTITLNPATGQGNSTTAVSGSGFRANATIEVLFDGVQRTTTPDPCVTTASGVFTGCQITVPFATGGSKTVLVRDVAESGNQRQATAPYNLQLTVGSLALGSTSGAWGSTVTVTGGNWPASRTTAVGSGIEISFGADVLTSCATSSGGALQSCSIVIPDIATGSYTVRATDPLNPDFNTSAATNGPFSLTGPAITLSDTSGGSGSTTAVSGHGFRASSSLEVLFAGTAMTTTGLCTTDAWGTFSGCQFTIPVATAGAKTVLVRDLPADGGQRSAQATYTVVLAATLNLSASAAAAGTTITATGGGWASNRNSTNGTVISMAGEQLAVCATTSVGALDSCTFRVPPQAAGLRVVDAVDGLNPFNNTSRSFTVLAPALSLAPGAGGSGAVVAAAGTGFRAGSSVQVEFAGAVVQTCLADAWGAFSACQLTVPAASATGSKTVIARDLPAGVLQRTAQTSFDLTTSVDLAPARGAEGSQLTVAGAGFNAGQTVEIRWGTSAQLLDTCASTAGGVLSGCAITVPVGATLGAHTVSATVTTGNPSSGRRSASATYTVVHATALAVQSASGTYGGTAALAATLSSPGGSVGGKTIAFELNGTAVGTGVTDGSGTALLSTASLTAITATASPYPSGVSATFAGDATHAAVTNTAALTVTPRQVTGAFTASDKVYDGTTTATIATRTLSGAVPGDAVSLVSGTATFESASVGTGKTVAGSGFALGGAAAANYTLASPSLTTTATITKRALTASFTVAGKTYDGSTAGTVNSRTLTGVLAGDTVTLDGGTVTFDSKNVGAGKSVVVSAYTLGGSHASDYSVNATAATTATITPRDLTVSANGQAKEYDATTAAVVAVTTDKVTLDSVTPTYSSASFDTKHVGDAKTVNVSGIGITGADAGNYTLTNSAAVTTASITPRQLTVSAVGGTKTYDRDTEATVTLSDNRLGSDVLTRTFTSAHYSSKHVGNAKLITVSGIAISGADAGNYVVNPTATTTGTITRRDISVVATGQSKVYDGTPGATVTLGDTRLAGDDLTAAYTSATFPDADAGFNWTVTVSGLSLSGPDAGNYDLITPSTTAFAHILVRPLTVTAAAQHRIYDGLTGATVTLSASNQIPGDAVTLNHTAAVFSSRTVGNAKTVHVSGISLGGADADNYSSNTIASTTANITQRQLTVSASATDKVYDAATAATASLSDNRVAGDVLSVGHTGAAFSSKTVGTGTQVTVGGITISGTDAANYSLASTTAITTASISARPLTVTASADDKVYDGTSAATVVLDDNRVAGDSLTRSFSSATFETKSVGNAKPVTVGGLSLGGTDAANYSLTSTTAATTAAITPRALSVAADGVDRVYDGTAIAGVTLSDDRVADDVLATSYGSAAFADKHVGNDKAISVTGIGISGPDADNYVVNTSDTTAADITPGLLTVTATAETKRYDGTTQAIVVLGDDRITDDVFTIGHDPAQFDSKTVGSDKTVTVGGITLSGADGANYTVDDTAITTASIVAEDGILVTFAAADKVYDGTTDATVTGVPILDGVKDGDDLTLTGGTVTFDSAAVGVGKTVTWDGFELAGADAANYELAERVATATAGITPKPLTVTADDTDMIWGQTAPAFASAYAGFVAGETPADLGGTLTHAVTMGAGTVVTVGPSTPAGTYTIIPDGQTATNYDITYVPGQLNIGFIAGSGSYRPDGLVSLRKTEDYSGNGVYNATGARQTKSAKVERSRTRTFYIRVQNDGDDLDTFTIAHVGAAKKGFDVAYFDGATQVTRKVMAGTYRMVGVDGGSTRVLRAVVSVGSRATVGATSTTGVRITSMARPKLADTVKNAATAIG